MKWQRKSEQNISCVDLFCGLGGLTHGLIRGGVRVTAGFDIDPQCRFPYEENNDARFIETDVRNLDAHEIEKYWEKGSYRLLAGCAPCQPFSTYSRSGRKLQSDDKWSLLRDFARLVIETQPDLVTMENVPQLVNHRVFSDFRRQLDGYYVSWRIIECGDYGVPQTRKRLVLLASKLGRVDLNSTSKSARPTVRHAISHLATLAAGQSDKQDAMHSASSLTPLNLRRIRASKPGGSWRDWPEELRADCHRRKSGETYPSVYGRMEWDVPAPTITTQCFGYGNGRFGHPEQDRAITLREAAILQTFPPTYKFLRDGDRPRFNVLGRLIGNAVPVRIGEIISHAFLGHVKATSPNLERTSGCTNG